MTFCKKTFLALLLLLVMPTGAFAFQTVTQPGNAYNPGDIESLFQITSSQHYRIYFAGKPNYLNAVNYACTPQGFNFTAVKVGSYYLIGWRASYVFGCGSGTTSANGVALYNPLTDTWIGLTANDLFDPYRNRVTRFNGSNLEFYNISGSNLVLDGTISKPLGAVAPTQLNAYSIPILPVWIAPNDTNDSPDSSKNGAWFYLGTDNYLHILESTNGGLYSYLFADTTTSYQGYYPSLPAPCTFGNETFTKCLALIQNVTSGTQTIKLRTLTTNSSSWVDRGDFSITSGYIQNHNQSFVAPYWNFGTTRWDTNCNEPGYNVCGTVNSVPTCMSSTSVVSPTGRLCGTTYEITSSDWNPFPENRFSLSSVPPWSIPPFISGNQICSTSYLTNNGSSYTATLNNGVTGTPYTNGFMGTWGEGTDFFFGANFDYAETGTGTYWDEELQTYLTGTVVYTFEDLLNPNLDGVAYTNKDWAHFYIKNVGVPITRFEVNNLNVLSGSGISTSRLASIYAYNGSGNIISASPNATIGYASSYSYDFAEPVKEIYLNFQKTTAGTGYIMKFGDFTFKFTSPNTSTVAKYSCSEGSKVCTWTDINTCSKQTQDTSYSCARENDYCRPATGTGTSYIPPEPPSYVYPNSTGGTVIQNNPTNVSVNPNIVVNVTNTGSSSGTDTGFWSGIFGSGTVSNALDGINDGIGGAISSLGDSIGEGMNGIKSSINGIFGSGTVSGPSLGTGGLSSVGNVGGTGTGSVTGSLGTSYGTGVYIDNATKKTCLLFSESGDFLYSGNGNSLNVGIDFSGLSDSQIVKDYFLSYLDKAEGVILNPVNSLLGIFSAVSAVPENSQVCLLGQTYTVKYQDLVAPSNAPNLQNFNALNEYKAIKGEKTFLDYFILIAFGLIVSGFMYMLLKPNNS